MIQARRDWCVHRMVLPAAFRGADSPVCCRQRKFLRPDSQIFLQRSSTRTTFGGSSDTRLRVWLIGLQVFGCTALLLVTGLCTKSLLGLLNQDKGLNPATPRSQRSGFP